MGTSPRITILPPRHVSNLTSSSPSAVLWLPLVKDDRPLSSEHDPALTREPNRGRELCIAVTSEIGIFERGFRDDEHMSKAASGLDEEYLGGLIERKEIAVQAIPEFPLKELPDKRHASFIERGAMTASRFGGQVPTPATPTLVFRHCSDGVLHTPCPGRSHDVSWSYEQSRWGVNRNDDPRALQNLRGFPAGLRRRQHGRRTDGF